MESEAAERARIVKTAIAWNDEICRPGEVGSQRTFHYFGERASRIQAILDVIKASVEAVESGEATDVQRRWAATKPESISGWERQLAEAKLCQQQPLKLGSRALTAIETPGEPQLASGDESAAA